MTREVWRVPRTRGAGSGLLLVALGIWGGIIAFVGPYFGYAYTPNITWTFTWGRLWLEILPAVATVLGGLILLGTAHRAIGHLGGWLAVAGGVWFLIGSSLSLLWNHGVMQTGTPVGGTMSRTVEQIGFFYGLGAAIVLLSAWALGRFAVVGVRERRLADADRAEHERALRERDYTERRERQVAASGPGGTGDAPAPSRTGSASTAAPPAGERKG